MIRKALLASLLVVTVLAIPSPAQAVEKRFSIRCFFSHAAQVDPIVSPGVVSHHNHAFVGNNTVAADSTYESMIAGGSSCGFSPDKAGYWIPTLISPTGQTILPISANAYYRSIGALANKDVQPFPPDLRLVSSRYDYSCGDKASTRTSGALDCRGQVDEQKFVRLRIIFPDCWDGVNLDSPDHISHLARQRSGGCPSTHPVPVPHLAVTWKFPVMHTLGGYTLSSGALTTAHGDFWNTWEQPVLEELVDRCLGAGVTRLCGRLG